MWATNGSVVSSIFLVEDTGVFESKLQQKLFMRVSKNAMMSYVLQIFSKELSASSSVVSTCEHWWYIICILVVLSHTTEKVDNEEVDNGQQLNSKLLLL